MRIFKFRYFNESKKEMIYFPEGVLDKTKECLQFTGIVNRKEQEIWEGDILRLENGRVGAVEYDKYVGGYIVKGDYHKHQHHLNLDDNQSYNSEVIGNIKENPDYPLTGGCWI